MASEVLCLVVGAPPAVVNVPTPMILPVPLSATPGEHGIISRSKEINRSHLSDHAYQWQADIRIDCKGLKRCAVIKCSCLLDWDWLTLDGFIMSHTSPWGMRLFLERLFFIAPGCQEFLKLLSYLIPKLCLHPLTLTSTHSLNDILYIVYWRMKRKRWRMCFAQWSRTSPIVIAYYLTRCSFFWLQLHGPRPCSCQSTWSWSGPCV